MGQFYGTGICTHDSPVSARSSARSKSASTIANLRATLIHSQIIKVRYFLLAIINIINCLNAQSSQLEASTHQFSQISTGRSIIRFTLKHISKGLAQKLYGYSQDKRCVMQDSNVLIFSVNEINISIDTGWELGRRTFRIVRISY